MIEEDYVSFEIAKLLKSKKFHVPTRSHYDGRGGFGFFDICEIDWNNYKCFRERRCYSAPTLQMTMKWLRKVHKLYIEITPSSRTNEFIVDSYRIDIVTKTFDTIYVSSGYDTYEQACEAAIKYCLENLI